MSKARRTNQGGSVATFIIVTVILAVALTGTVFYIKKHGEQVRKEQAIALYEKQQAEQKVTEEKASTETKTDDSTGSLNVGEVGLPENNEISSNNLTQILPETGPALEFDKILGLGLMAGLVVSYLFSRRHLLRPL